MNIWRNGKLIRKAAIAVAASAMFGLGSYSPALAERAVSGSSLGIQLVDFALAFGTTSAVKLKQTYEEFRITVVAASAETQNLRSNVDEVTTGSVPKSFFGTVALPFSAIAVRGQWVKVRNQPLPNLTNCKTDSCRMRVGQVLDAVKRGASRDFAGKLALANATANRIIEYKTDRQNYGKLDHWAGAAQIVQRGSGDCEDYAILKQSLLRAMGVPDKSMSIIILKDTARNLYHAVLGVSTNQGHLILDNVKGDVFRDVNVTNYRPLFSFSGDRSWVHGTKADPAMVAASGNVSLNDIVPGESAAVPDFLLTGMSVGASDLRPTLQY
jgi:predicted transglutaminase-like cysteine proteinase